MFKRIRVQTLQQVASTDPLRAGRWSNRALANVARELLQCASNPTGTWANPGGFFRDSFLVEGIVGSFDVNVRDGLGFQYDATGITADDSPMRPLVLEADYTLSTGGAPPAAGVYNVFVRWGTADTYNEARQVRPAPGAAFAGNLIDTATEPVPTIVWSALGAIAGYVQIATVTVPGAPADSTAYAYTDLRVNMTDVIRYEQVSLAAISAGAGWTAPTIANFRWTAGALATNPIIFSIPARYGTDIGTNRSFSVFVYCTLVAAGDDGSIAVQAINVSLGGAALGNVPSIAAKIGAAPSSGWVEVPCAGAYSQVQHIFMWLIPNTGAAGDLTIESIYKRSIGKYLGC